MKLLFMKLIPTTEPHIPEKQSANWPRFFGWLIFMAFAARLLLDLAEAFAESGVQSAAVITLLWVTRLGVGPLVVSGIFYVIHAALAWSQPMSLTLFVLGVRKHALSFIGLTFFYMLLSLAVFNIMFLTIVMEAAREAGSYNYVPFRCPSHPSGHSTIRHHSSVYHGSNRC